MPYRKVIKISDEVYNNIRELIKRYSLESPNQVIRKLISTNILISSFERLLKDTILETNTIASSRFNDIGLIIAYVKLLNGGGRFLEIWFRIAKPTPVKVQ